VGGCLTAIGRGVASSPRTVALLIFLARPLLRIHLALYRRDVQRAPFPEDAPESVIPGPDPIRLLLIGDVTVSGYGVLRHQMTTAFQTARFIAENRESGCSWTSIAAPDLTVARVASMSTLDASGVDVVLIMLGIPDVLLATTTAAWTAGLENALKRLRASAAPGCRYIFAGIPPMADFRPIPPVARKMLTLQIGRLNGVTREFASRTADATFVPSPHRRVGDKYIQEEMSWKSLHHSWARILSTATLRVLNEANTLRPEPGRDSRTSN
jgi:lysophospholipase L1-like esterase